MPSAVRATFFRFARWATGAKEDEVGRVCLSFLALLFLLISYYLIKPLRSSQFLKEFSSDFLPVVTIIVVFLSLFITKIFTYLADRMEKYRLVTRTYLLIMVLKVAFAWLLGHAGKPAVVAFYFFACVYFLLAIATIWACINDIFTPEQSERCFGFIAIGSTFGTILGSRISAWLSASEWRDYATVASSVSMGIALMFLLAAARKRRGEREQQGPPPSSPAVDNGAGSKLWSDLNHLLQRPYVRRIGVMVAILAMFNISLDFISHHAIDEGVSRTQFRAVFSSLPDEDFAKIYPLKLKSQSVRWAELETIGAKIGRSQPEMVQDYRKYRARCEAQIRTFFSDVYLYQGLLGIFLLLVVARTIFARLGLRYAVVILPVMAGISVLAFGFPLELLTVQVIMVVVGSTNYSLNNAAKEILYTATDEETKFKYKPLIEGPGMRIGDVTASLLTLALTRGALLMGFGPRVGELAFLGVLLVLIGVWFRAAYLAGVEYDEERARRGEGGGETA